jgi:hypothetical protein
VSKIVFLNFLKQAFEDKKFSQHFSTHSRHQFWRMYVCEPQKVTEHNSQATTQLWVLLFPSIFEEDTALLCFHIFFNVKIMSIAIKLVGDIIVI